MRNRTTPDDFVIWVMSGIAAILAIWLAYGCVLAAEDLADKLGAKTPETHVKPLEGESEVFDPDFQVDPNRVTTTQKEYLS